MALTISSLHTQIREKASERELVISNCISAGNIFANIAIVSTAPGYAEIRTGIPFSGGAGNILWDACRKKGITRNDVYVTNVIKAAINAREEMERKALSSATFGLWSELLKWELSQLPNLRYILVLGNEALQALTGKTGILHERGSWLTGKVWARDVDMLVTINPAMVARCNRILRGEEDSSAPPLRAAHKIFEFDINKFRLLVDGKLTRYNINAIINPSFKEAIEYINDCAHSPNPVATDIETVIGHSKNFKDETACIGFAQTSSEGMCIPFIDNELQSYWSLQEEKAIRQAIAAAYQKQKKWVAQNGIFDAIWLWFNDKIQLPIYFDTLLAHHTLYPNLPHSLEFLCSRYTTHPYYKSDKDGWKSVGGIDRFWRYNVTDCCITLAVQQATQQELVKAGLDEFFFNHVMKLHPHLSRMTVGGIKVDDEYKQYIRTELETRLEHMLVEFQQAVHVATDEEDYNPNPRSPKDKGELFFNKLKLIGRGTATDKANIKRMVSHPKTSPEAKEVLTKLSAYTKAFKFYSVYANSKIDADGRVRCEYKQFGTTKAPGRLSSAQAPWETGLNLQTIPAQAYPMFCCEPGYCLIYFDLEQAEARVVGWLAGIQKWIDDFERARIGGNFDCHRSLAADMWNMPYDDVPHADVDDEGNFTLRYIAKRSRHGLNYRMQIMRLAETTGLSLPAAADAFNRYHRINPGLRKWWQATEQQVIKTKTLYNLYGRRWVLTELITEQTLESIVAFVPQSTIGDKVNRVIYKAEEDDDWPHDARIALNIHDALIGIAPIAKADTCLKILQKHAEEPLYIPNQPPLIIPAALKKTKKATSWRIVQGKDGKDKVEFYDNETNGFHRWSELSKVVLD